MNRVGQKPILYTKLRIDIALKGMPGCIWKTHSDATKRVISSKPVKCYCSRKKSLG